VQQLSGPTIGLALWQQGGEVGEDTHLARHGHRAGGAGRVGDIARCARKADRRAVRGVSVARIRGDAGGQDANKGGARDTHCKASTSSAKPQVRVLEVLCLYGCLLLATGTDSERQMRCTPSTPVRLVAQLSPHHWSCRWAGWQRHRSRKCEALRHCWRQPCSRQRTPGARCRHAARVPAQQRQLGQQRLLHHC
jgi:hypothetical protein